MCYGNNKLDWFDWLVSGTDWFSIHGILITDFVACCIFMVMEIMLDFFTLNSMSHVLLHWTSLSRSRCKRWQSDRNLTSRYKRQSSAKSRMGEDMSVTKMSFMNTRNNKGPIVRYLEGLLITQEPLVMWIRQLSLSECGYQEMIQPNPTNHVTVKIVVLEF